MNQDTNFVFIDLEWEQVNIRPSAKDQIVEIGATKLGFDSKFIRYISSDRVISRHTRQLLGIHQSKIDEGISLDKAMNELKSYCGRVSTVVVWSYYTKQKLQSLAKKYNNKDFVNNIIILQELIRELTESEDSIAFDSALIAMGARYDPRYMHNAGFDVKCLKDLFVKLTSKYEEINPILQKGIIQRDKSEIYHVQGCPCLRKDTDDEELLEYKDVTRFVPCKRCIGKLKPLKLDIDSNEEIRKIKKIKGYKGKSVNIDQMYEIAEFFGLNITGGLGAATINTGYSYWKVFCDDRGFAKKLSHENHKTKHRVNNGFHNHEEFSRDIFSLFEYIFLHDENSKIKPIADALEREQQIKQKKKKQQRFRKMIEQDEWEKYYDS